MKPVLHDRLPRDMWPDTRLPGTRPVDGSWLRVDEAYAGQMALRGALITERPGDVLYMSDTALQPAQTLLEQILEQLGAFGFDVKRADVTCPDGRRVVLDHKAPLRTLGLLLQCDFCLLGKVGDEHHLKGAVLCFPASWTLREKVERPLSAIHGPVAEYTDDMQRRVQRLFDGLHEDRPLWRYNRLWYEDPTLYAPKPEGVTGNARTRRAASLYFRAERQTLFRLGASDWIVFAIHTYVLPADRVPFSVAENVSETVSVSGTRTPD